MSGGILELGLAFSHIGVVILLKVAGAFLLSASFLCRCWWLLELLGLHFISSLWLSWVGALWETM